MVSVTALGVQPPAKSQTSLPRPQASTWFMSGEAPAGSMEPRTRHPYPATKDASHGGSFSSSGCLTGFGVTPTSWKTQQVDQAGSVPCRPRAGPGQTCGRLLHRARRW